MEIRKEEIELQHNYYVKTASDYDTVHNQSNDQISEHHLSLRHISALFPLIDVSSVLDVGCGTGRGVKYFQQMHPCIQVLGIEPVQELILAGINNSNISPESMICGKGESLPFEDCKFDVVCAFGVMHHTPNPDIVVKEMMRVAKKAVFISDANRFGQGSTLLRLFKLCTYFLGLWPLVDFIRTKGKRYMYSEGDGIFYSYSVYDNYKILSKWADRVILIPTERKYGLQSSTWLHPLLTTSHILVCAIKD